MRQYKKIVGERGVMGSAFPGALQLQHVFSLLLFGFQSITALPQRYSPLSWIMSLHKFLWSYIQRYVFEHHSIIHDRDCQRTTVETVRSKDRNSDAQFQSNNEFFSLLVSNKMKWQSCPPKDPVNMALKSDWYIVI